MYHSHGVRSGLGGLVLALGLLWNGMALAVSDSPMPMLRSTTKQMLFNLKQLNHAGHKPKVSQVEGVVRRLLLPKVDQTRMAQAVVGRTHWMKASASTQVAFTSEFMAMIIHIYSEALAGYEEQTVKFLPVRSRPGIKRVQVKSLVEHPNGPTIEVSYTMVRRDDAWRVADFSVDGISMIQSYRSQFAGVLSEKGFEGLLAQIKIHNRKLASAKG